MIQWHGQRESSTSDDVTGRPGLTLLGGGTTSSDDRLDLVRVDESGDVGRRDLGGGEPDSEGGA